MRRRENWIIVAMLMTGIGFSSKAQNQESQKYTAGIHTGYYGGFGIHANVRFDDLSRELPFILRGGIGYILSNPGNAGDARRIFINNATNGVPEKQGRTFDYRLDFMLPRTIFNVANKAINQPSIMPRAMIGVSFKL